MVSTAHPPISHCLNFIEIRRFRHNLLLILKYLSTLLMLRFLPKVLVLKLWNCYKGKYIEKIKIKEKTKTYRTKVKIFNGLDFRAGSHMRTAMVSHGRSHKRDYQKPEHCNKITSFFL